ncbi:hypothetical protein L0664_01150 [Octadecabacter sp. G9-8]|uniref:Uncharacterized protein n=1 Tax=Octadecabacter dasysiphoniae TaxID=2909341 RepID=A0ABS9CQZ9_9RHOB|nr:hypothetical protein [Octadecabacter dasysiphoniae]MCF2869659.1 hypothetical protein [Octadecabacter dasysiphoniae]
MMKPVIMGGLMGLMMMWMLHGAVTGDGMAAGALIAFVGAHLALVVIAGAVIWAGTRFSPRVVRVLSRLHRPSRSHVMVMLASAIVVAGVVHLSAHGFGGMV